jgi:hypothetical protein
MGTAKKLATSSPKYLLIFHFASGLNPPEPLRRISY